MSDNKELNLESLIASLNLDDINLDDIDLDALNLGADNDDLDLDLDIDTINRKLNDELRANAAPEDDAQALADFTQEEDSLSPSSEDLELPNLPGTTELPQIDVPDMPDLPDMPALDMPDIPELDIPDIPALDIPDMPVLDMPDMLDLPTVPDFADLDIPVSQSPPPVALPDMSSMDMSDMNLSDIDLSDIDIPDIPDIPDITDLPNIPDLPTADLPGLPDFPDFPDVPDVPSAPAAAAPPPEVASAPAAKSPEVVPSLEDMLSDLDLPDNLQNVSNLELPEDLESALQNLDLDLDLDLPQDALSLPTGMLLQDASESDGDSSSYLDALINEALAKEKINRSSDEDEDEELNLSPDMLALGRSSSVYDEEYEAAIKLRANTESTFKARKKIHPEILRTRKLIALVGLLGVLVAGTVFTGVRIAFSPEARRLNFQRQGGVYLIQHRNPDALVNNAHQIFIPNGHMSLPGRDLNVVAATFDIMGSLFVFENPVDLSVLNFFIWQDDGTVKFVDLMTLDTSTPTTQLRMQPLTEGVTDFTLMAADTATGQYANLPFRVSGGFDIAPVRHLQGRTDISPEGDPSLRVFLESGTFSPTFTHLTYSIHSYPPILTAGALTGFDPGVTLQESARNMRVFLEHSASFQEDTVVAGSVTLPPLRSLTQPVDITVGGIHREFSLNHELEVGPLHIRANPPTVLTIGNGRYELFLEGMTSSPLNNTYILVYHMQDPHIAPPFDPEFLLTYLDQYRYRFRSDFAAIMGFYSRYGIDPYFNRVDTMMDVYMLVDTVYGQVRIPGEVLHSRRGSDVFFNLAEFGTHVTNAPITAKSIFIESVTAIEDPTIHRLYLPEDLAYTQDLLYEEALEHILQQVNNRLRFKSGQVQMTALGGFDERVFANRADFARHYTPVAGAGAGALHSAQVLAWTVANDHLNVIVREKWQANAFEPVGEHLLTHKIYAERDSRGYWVIVHNEILY